MKKLLSITAAVCILQFCNAQTDYLFLGQSPPGTTPIRFNIPFRSGDKASEYIAISPDGKEIYYGETTNGNTHYWIKYFTYSNGAWSDSSVLFDGYTGPALSPSGDTLLFHKYSNGFSAIAYFSVRNDTGWSTPSIFAGGISITYLQKTNSGSYYLIKQGESNYISKMVSSISDTVFNNLGLGDQSFAISRDESFIIFQSANGEFGNYDLFISYKKNNATWTNPKNLGSPINTSDYEVEPYVTADNKYLFFMRANPSQLIYWVRVDNLIDSLRHTNFIPYVKNQIPNQQATKDLMFNYQIPDSTFLDDDGNKTLTYSATLINGNPLPDWLFFDPATRIFSGPSSALGVYNIKVTAKDSANASVSTTFKITVALLSIDYFGQVPPGDSAKIFTPGAVLQPNRPEQAGAFSRDGKEFYFCVSTMNWDTFNTYVRKFKDGNWTEEALASFSSISGGATEVFFNKRNSRIIFVSKGTGSTSDGWMKTDFWIVERKGDSLGNPVKLSPAINDIEVQWHPSVSDSGHIYFGSKGSVYIADCSDDTTFGSPVKLNDPNINLAGSTNAEVFIAQDESYIIFSSNRPGGYGEGDLYISFKKTDYTWDTPVNLGPRINSESADFSPGLTPDGKYLLFSRDDGSTRHIYWVSSSFIDSIKKQFPELIRDISICQKKIL